MRGSGRWLGADGGDPQPAPVPGTAGSGGRLRCAPLRSWRGAHLARGLGLSARRRAARQVPGSLRPRGCRSFSAPVQVVLARESPGQDSATVTLSSSPSASSPPPEVPGSLAYYGLESERMGVWIGVGESLTPSTLGLSRLSLSLAFPSPSEAQD